ncbi:MAG: tripartite tricarboxylate transporter substrate binding protein [Candidatus Methylomirabilota bacterium]
MSIQRVIFKCSWFAVLGVAVMLLGVSLASSADFPTKPIRIISPFAPGGGTDIMARSMSAVMGKEKILSVPVIVENKPGGSGAVGYDYVAGKQGDPYYLVTVTTQFFTNPILKTQKASFRDFTMICQVAFDPNLVLVRADFPYNSMKELIEAAKKEPGKFRWGGTGSTGSDRILTLMLEKSSGAKFNFIPFQSGGEVTTALLGKHVDLVTNQVNESISQIQAGKFKALAIGGSLRSPYLPNLPTLKESGADITTGSYRGIAAPAGIPAEAKKALEEAFKKLDASGEWQKNYIEKFQLQREFRDGEGFRKLTEEKLSPDYEAMFKAVGVIK